MGIFGFLRRNNPETPQLKNDEIKMEAPKTELSRTNEINIEDYSNKETFKQEIPKQVFIEERDPDTILSSINLSGAVKGIEAIYNFLQADYEARGYSDALINPDDSYKADNILLLKQDLQILIKQANIYYEDIVRELDFHIGSRGRAGLVDLVEELNSRKEMVREHMSKVKEVQDDLENQTGLSHRVALSYQRGFMRGLATLTQSSILNKPI